MAPYRATSPATRAGDAHPLIAIRHLSKEYPTPAGSFTALSDISFTLDAGEFLTVVGKSGSGKSTLINLIAGIDRPSAGTLDVAGMALHQCDQERLTAWRGRTVGVVFQFFQLLPTLTVAENVMLPMDFCNTYPARARRGRALQLLERVGIAEQADKLPAALSGGQQQRAAIARSLANDPPLLVADEPTGNLDSVTAGSILQLFADLAREGKTVIMVTHAPDMPHATRSITLVDGRLIAEHDRALRVVAPVAAEVIHG